MPFLCLRVCWWGLEVHHCCRPQGRCLRRTVDAYPLEMDVWWSWSASCMVFSRNKLNRIGESKHPWLTPTVVLRNSPDWLFMKTALLEFSYSARIVWNSSSLLKLLGTCHRLARQTPQWGAADAEIKVPSGENTELKRSPFKVWSRSVYSNTCYAYCQEFLPRLFLPFRSIHLHFF